MGLTLCAWKEDRPISSPANHGKKRVRARERTTPARHAVISNKGDKPPTTCREEVAFLDRYLSSDLSERQRAHFESHLAVCRDCVAFLQTYKTTIELTRSFLSSQAKAGPSYKLVLKQPNGRAKRR
jgi:anti-sigma factor RsiW